MRTSPDHGSNGRMPDARPPRATYPRDWSRCRACGAIYEMGAPHTHVEPPSRPLSRPVLRVILGGAGDLTIDLRDDPQKR